MNVAKHDTAEIVEIVKSYLASAPPRDYRLQVFDKDVRQEDDWWYVTVVPDRPGVKSHEFAEHLAVIEEMLRDKEQIKVLLVPSIVVD